MHAHNFHYEFYSLFGKNRLGSSIIDPIGKTVFTADFLTVTNTLDIFGYASMYVVI